MQRDRWQLPCHHNWNLLNPGILCGMRSRSCHGNREYGLIMKWKNPTWDVVCTLERKIGTPLRVMQGTKWQQSTSVCIRDTPIPTSLYQPPNSWAFVHIKTTYPQRNNIFGSSKCTSMYALNPVFWYRYPSSQRHCSLIAALKHAYNVQPLW